MAMLGLAVSCVEDLYPGTLGPDRILAMNADLYSTDTLHTVLLYFSGHNSIEYAEGATVSIYVNGELTDVTSEDIRDKDGRHENEYARYQLKARFSEGDRVKVVAEKDDYHIEAEETVPPCPSTGKTSYDIVIEKDPLSDNVSKYISMNVEVEDDKTGMDYYAVEVFLNKLCIKDDDGEVVEEIYDRINVDVSKEPLLTANFPSSFEDIDSTEYDEYSNFLFWAFTDNSFRDSSYSLLLRAPYTYQFLPHHGMSASSGYDENGNWISVVEKFTMSLSLEVRLSRVPRSVYSTYMYKYFEYCTLSSLVLFDTNHEYQSNVSGGTGVMNLWSSRIEEIGLGTFHYDVYNSDYDLTDLPFRGDMQ